MGPIRNNRLQIIALCGLTALILSFAGCRPEETDNPGILVLPTPDVTPTPGPEPTETPPDVDPTPTPHPTPEPPTPTPYPVAEADTGDVVVTEIMVDPRDAFDTDGEWFEVTSRLDDRRIDLDGWRLTTPGGGSHTISTDDGLLLEPGGTLVLGASADLALNGGVVIDYVYSGLSFPNSGEGGISLFNGGDLIDAVIYDLSDGFADLEGHALSLDPEAYDEDDNDEGSSWCAAFAAINRGSDRGSPGQPNPACGEDDDGDGWWAEHDCDDDNPSINPRQAEVAGNSRDDDCDLEVDEPALYPPGALLITEIMYNPGRLEDRAGEWFEIINTTETSINLRDWVVGDAEETFTIEASSVVPPGTRILLGLNDAGTTNGGVFVSQTYTGFTLDDTRRPGEGYADTLRLMYQNLVIDEVTYDVGGDFPTADGESLSLREDAFDPAKNDLASSWCLSYTTYGNAGDMGTPGTVNTSCRADADRDGYNEVLDCDDTDPDVHPDAQEVPGNGKDDDCDGTTDEKPPVAGQIIITELMIDPSSVADGDGEYIELYNLSDEAIDINGWKLRDDGLEEHVIESRTPLLVPAKGYFILAINGDEASNGHVPVDYEYGYDFELDNDADEVILENDQVIVDQVIYDEGSGWSIPKGRSLGLDDGEYDAFQNDASSAWCQAQSQIPPGTGTDKGSPGAGNDDCD